MVKHLIYEIRNVRTGQRYIGTSGYSWMHRVQQHLSKLCRRCHHAPRFQAAWDASSGIMDWSFRVLLNELPNRRAGKYRERIMISDSDPATILNEQFGQGISAATIRQVRLLREKRWKLTDIAEKVEISLGSVSNIVNRKECYA